MRFKFLKNEREWVQKIAKGPLAAVRTRVGDHLRASVDGGLEPILRQVRHLHVQDWLLRAPALFPSGFWRVNTTPFSPTRS